MLRLLLPPLLTVDSSLAFHVREEEEEGEGEGEELVENHDSLSVYHRKGVVPVTDGMLPLL